MLSGGTLLAGSIVVVPFAGAAALFALRGWDRARLAAPFIALAAAGLDAVLLAWFGATVRLPVFWQTAWAETAGIYFGLSVDSLSFQFATLVAGVSLLSLLYSVRYLPHWIEKEGRSTSEAGYYGYMLLFTGAMLGMLFAADLVQLYVFWELTGIASFLLIGLNWREAEARAGAIRALLITAFGGIGILLCFVLVGSAMGTFSLPGVLEEGEKLRVHPVFSTALLLLVIGAATKSAQVPFHVWLPGAMVAPTPVSAFLHSAALVAAGVYLLSRFHPLFAASSLWQGSVTAIGLVSMITGGVLALKATKIKELLAYSTISQYGLIFSLLGYGSSTAFGAALFSFFQHGIIKAGLFFVAGIVTHATGSKELGTAGRMWRRLPGTFAAALLLALSLGGVPALAGFWTKELFLQATLETESVFLSVIAVAGSTLTILYMLRFLAGCFFEGPAHSPPLEQPALSMIAVPTLLALLTLLFGLAPGLASTAIVEPAARAVVGEPVHLELALHADLKLLLSLLALGLGGTAFATRRRWEPLVEALRNQTWSLDRLYGRLVSLFEAAGQAALSLQNGVLTRYVMLVILGLVVLIAVASVPVLPALSMMPPVGESDPTYTGLVGGAMALLLLLVILGAALAIVLRSHLNVVIALSAVGYLVAGVFGLEYAPDVALVQVHVETLVTVLFVLALVRIPARVRGRFSQSIGEQLTAGMVALAAMGGLATFWITWLAMEYEPTAPIAPWFNNSAEELAHARDVVAAIIVEFRALDTLGEITVFATAAAGVFALARLIRGEAE